MRSKIVKIIILQSAFLLQLCMVAMAQDLSVAEIESFFKKEASETLGLRDRLDYLKEKSETGNLYSILVNKQNQLMLINREKDLMEVVALSEIHPVFLSYIKADSNSNVEMIFVCDGDVEMRDTMLQILYHASRELRHEKARGLIVFDMEAEAYNSLNPVPPPPPLPKESVVVNEDDESEYDYTEEELIEIGERHNKMSSLDEKEQQILVDDQIGRDNGFWHSPFGTVILAIVGVLGVVAAYYIFKIAFFALLTGLLFAVVGAVIAWVVCACFSFEMNLTLTVCFIVGIVFGILGIVFSAFNVKEIIKSRLISELPNVIMDDLRKNEKLNSEQHSLERNVDLASRDFNNEVSKIGSDSENEYSLSRSASKKAEAEQRLSDFESKRRNGQG